MNAVAMDEKVKPYMRLEHELLEALCQLELSGRQHRVLLAVIRKTIGWNNDVDWITAKQLCDVMAYTGAPTHINADLKVLAKRNIVVFHGKKIGVNVDVTSWVYAKSDQPKTVTKGTENGHYATDRKRSQKEPKTVTQETENGHYATDRKRSQLEPKTVTALTENGLKRNRKRSTQKKKETYTKETIKLINHANSTIQTLENFEITDELQTWADEQGITQWIDLQTATKDFIKHHQSEGTRLNDWNKAWVGWMKNAEQFAMASFKQPKQVMRKPRFQPPVGTYSHYSTPASKIAEDFAPIVKAAEKAKQQRPNTILAH